MLAKYNKKSKRRGYLDGEGRSSYHVHPLCSSAESHPNHTTRLKNPMRSFKSLSTVGYEVVDHGTSNVANGSVLNPLQNLRIKDLRFHSTPDRIFIFLLRLDFQNLLDHASTEIGCNPTVS